MISLSLNSSFSLQIFKTVIIWLSGPSVSGLLDTISGLKLNLLRVSGGNTRYFDALSVYKDRFNHLKCITSDTTN